MHLIEAVEILALDNNWTQEDLKKRYFTLAKEYHPDKNPSGSDHFKKIKEAYETLKNVESGGSNPFIDSGFHFFFYFVIQFFVGWCWHVIYYQH